MAMLGVQFPVVVNGDTYILYGTSASSPLFASFVSLLNALRINSGQTSVGWLNPLLYSAGDNVTFSSGEVIFTDITSGDNKCCANSNPALAVCCTSGFTTTTGWDPATGWGSITFSNFAALYGFTVGDYVPSDSDDNDSLLGAGAITGIALAVLVVVGVSFCYFMGYLRPRKGEQYQWSQQLNPQGGKPQSEMGNPGYPGNPGNPYPYSQQPEAVYVPPQNVSY